MKLHSLHLHQFRCFERLRIAIPGEAVIFHGDNAQGKTSILESVCVMLRLQSPRTSALAECVQFGSGSFSVGGRLERPDDQFELGMQFRESGKRLQVDGERQSRTGDYLRHSSLVVWMANDDLSLIRGGGDARRRFLDFIAIQLFPDYRSSIKAYDKALRSRNFLLKRDASPNWQQIDAYTVILHREGKVISARRRELVAALDPLSSTSQFEISGRTGEDLQIAYQSASGEDDDLESALKERRAEEEKKRQTAAGPHRDDVGIVLNGMPAAKFASEGQQRTIALSLKLAQTRLFIREREHPPLLLIDDVFGELDPSRRNFLMTAWPNDSQKLITTTHLDWLDSEFRDARQMHVKEGEVCSE